MLMNLDEVATYIKRNEGFRDKVYKDSLGYLTCGYGHALHENSHVPFTVANIFFDLDFRRVIQNYESLDLHLWGVRRAVVMDMIFNLGIAGFLSFKKLINAIREERWPDAAAEILDSKYAKQVPTRAKRNAAFMLKGER